jgi:multiple sugar transport system substrate-binding protein
VHSKPVFEQWFTSEQGYTDGATEDWEKEPVWKIDPILLRFRDLPAIGRRVGYAGPPPRS